MTTTEPATGRMSAADRRAAIVQAASAVFGRHGYTGTTTDEVARAAGISQPYVVRMFGSKEALFLEVVASAEGALLEAFRAVLADPAVGREPGAVIGALGDQYLELARDRGIHLALLQAFTQGADPVVGARARRGYLAIWRMLREEAGLDAEQATDFLARGMLISVLLSLDMPAALPDPAAAELLQQACGDTLDELLTAIGPPA